jgi:hypothetical protein
MEPEPGEEILRPGMAWTAPAGLTRGVRVGRLPSAKEGVVFFGPGGPLNGAWGSRAGSLGLNGVVHAQEEPFHGPGPGLTIDLVEECQFP